MGVLRMTVRYRRSWIFTVSLILTMPLAISIAEAQRGDISFDVASIRPNTSGALGGRFRVFPGGRLRVRNFTLRRLVARAYGIDIRQVLNGPPWIDRERFDIEATVGDIGVQADDVLVRAMLRNLLAERFQLQTTFEARETRYYALVVVNQQAELPRGIRPSAVSCNDFRERLEREGPQAVRAAGSYCGLWFTLTSSGLLTVRSDAAPMTELASYLQVHAGRLIRDETRLDRLFTINLTFRPEPTAFNSAVASSATDGLPLSAALEQQLGIRLEPRRGDVDMLIVTNAKRPSRN